MFLALLLHPRRDRKSLSYTGGIRVSGLDFGFPCPYGALESYLTKDGRRVMTRDPGAGRGCAGTGLRREALLRAADALPARRAAADRRCRAHFGAVGQPAPAESDAGDRWVPRQLQVLPKVSGAMPCGAAYWPPSERMPAKKNMSSLHIRNAPRFSPGADPQALWPRSQSPRTAP